MVAEILVNEVEILVCHIDLVFLQQFVDLDEVSAAACLDVPDIFKRGITGCFRRAVETGTNCGEIAVFVMV